MTEVGEKEPTNAGEDLKQIKNFRKIHYEKVKEEVFKKIDDNQLSNKDKINRSLSQLLETRSLQNTNSLQTAQPAEPNYEQAFKKHPIFEKEIKLKQKAVSYIKAKPPQSIHKVRKTIF